VSPCQITSRGALRDRMAVTRGSSSPLEEEEEEEEEEKEADDVE
jgi:hypothetical protein